MITLVAAKEKEEFYRKFGFEKRPTEILGCAMSMWIQQNKKYQFIDVECVYVLIKMIKAIQFELF